MKTLIINEELKNLLPPLSDEEFKGLEESILKEGCLSPLIAWNDMIVDGHYRYDICTKHTIPFSVKNTRFENIDDAKLWAWQHQEHRRNLTPFHRSEIALKLKEIIATKAKERQRRMATPRKNAVGNDPVNTCKELSGIAGVSTDTLRKVEYIVEHADEQTKQKLRNGERGTSIHREYMRIKPEPQTEKPPTQTKKERSSGPVPERVSKMLLNTRSAAFVRELLLRLLCDYRERYGKSEADTVCRYICTSYDLKQ